MRATDLQGISFHAVTMHAKGWKVCPPQRKIAGGEIGHDTYLVTKDGAYLTDANGKYLILR